MIKILTVERQTIKSKTILTAIGIVMCILLPQIVHFIGALTGLGTIPGKILLPMHLPVLAVGLLSGGVAGLICGIASPILSGAMCGMPGAALVPFMAIELGVYGLVAGLMSKRNISDVAKVLSAQLAGRLARSVAVILAVFVIGSNSVSAAQAYNYLAVGIPGVVLQLVLLPLLMKWVSGLER